MTMSQIHQPALMSDLLVEGLNNRYEHEPCLFLVDSVATYADGRRATSQVVQAPKLIDFKHAIPLTAVGKPDKKILKARYWQGRERAV